MSEQIPQEFDWLKPGIKAHHCLLGSQMDVVSFPHRWYANKSIWVVCVDAGITQRCQDLIPAPITLTLTHDLAEMLFEHLEPYSFNGLDLIYEQLKEKLKC